VLQGTLIIRIRKLRASSRAAEHMKYRYANIIRPGATLAIGSLIPEAIVCHRSITTVVFVSAFSKVTCCARRYSLRPNKTC